MVVDAYTQYAEPYVSPYYELLSNLKADEMAALACAVLPLLSLLFTLLVAYARAGVESCPSAPPEDPPRLTPRSGC